MTQEEIKSLQNELESINERLNNKFVDPKDIRRKDQILSLLMTDGGSDDVKFTFVKGRRVTKGMNCKKQYYRWGKVG